MNFQKLSRRLFRLVLLNFCLISVAFAQNKLTPFQELAQKIAAAKSETERNALLEQNKDLQTIDLRKALLAEAFRFRVEGSYDKALTTDNFAWQFAGRIDDKAGVAAAINNVGVDYQEIGQYKTAIEFFKQSLEHKNALKDQTGITSSSNNIGLSYIYVGEYKLAEQYLQKALKTLEDANRKDVMMTPINNLGIIQRRLGNQARARARAYYEQSLRLSEETNNKNGAALALSNLAVLKIEEGDFPAALELPSSGGKSSSNRSITETTSAIVDVGVEAISASFWTIICVFPAIIKEIKKTRIKQNNCSCYFFNPARLFNK